MDNRSILTDIRDVVYFGQAPTGPLDAAAADHADLVTGSWTSVADQSRATDPDDDPFILSEHSERAYRVLLADTLSEPRPVTKSRRVAAYSAVQLARFSSRYAQYFSDDSLTPFVDWFRTAHENPGACTCWRLSDAHETAAGVAEHAPDGNDWLASAYAVGDC